MELNYKNNILEKYLKIKVIDNRNILEKVHEYQIKK